MARALVIAGNWKMHKLRAEALEFAHELNAWGEEHLAADKTHGGLEVVLAPPHLTLELMMEASPPCGIFAQTMHQADSGAFTGEVSPAMLRDIGVDGVLLGHSERRAYFNETDDALADKLHAAMAFGLRPMLCVGETIDERRSGSAEAVVERQLRTALDAVDVDEAAKRLYVAYEPVWAIGTGETATPQIAQDMHAHIRGVIADALNADAACEVPVLYGGSVKPGNAAELLSQDDIDGALIGGASLTMDSFTALIAAGQEQLAGVAR